MSQESFISNPRFAKSMATYKQAENYFPYGTQLLSRSPRLGAFGHMPIFFDRAKDGHSWDIDGNEFVDWSMGVGPVTLGYCYGPVDDAAKAQIGRGCLGSLNNAVEVEMAQALCQMVPCAEMVKFCKGGGEADAIAVRIARGHTGKDVVLFCGYHGWHDWYLAANLDSAANLNEHLRPGISPKGVPAALAGTSVPFEYNNLDSLRQTLEQNAGKVACIIMEATRFSDPGKGYLEGVRQLADEHECLLIFDEVVTGFRMANGGAQEYYGVTPDLASFGKGIANGYPLAAVGGKAEIMGSQYDNFISSTYFSDPVALAAGVATLKELRDKPVIQRLNDIGEQLIVGIKNAAAKHGVKAGTLGHSNHFAITFDYGTDTGKVATLYMQEMAARGVLCMCQAYICYTHTQADIDQTIAATEETFEIVADALSKNRLAQVLKAPEREVVFRRRMV